MKRIVFTSLLLASSLANAASHFGQTKITGIVLSDFGDIQLTFNSAVVNEAGCKFNNEVSLTNDTNKLYQETYSAALAAFHAGTVVHGWVNGCATDGRAILTRLDIRKVN